eukprot:gene32696-42340_t
MESMRKGRWGKLISLALVPTRRFSNQVFDSNLKIRQRQRSFDLADGDYYDYLRKECADRLVDKLEDIHSSRQFPVALELGSYRGHVLDSLEAFNSVGIQHLVQLEAVRDREKTIQPLKVQGKDFFYDLNSFDLVLSSINLHWVNNLPFILTQIRTALKPDGVFVASLLGGSTLQELRYCFYLAEQERRGGLSSHASPLALPSDIAALVQDAGFALPTVDVDKIKHLWKMGEGSASLNRQYAVGRDTFLAMAALYQDGSVVATFEVISVIGWSPDASQPKACKRGSASHSLKELSKT